MAGHSKWANIKHKKAAQDAKRGKIFTKLIREIVVATKMGGSDQDSNPRLRDAVSKALSANMKRDTIDNAIKRGSGAQDSDNYDEIRYEGYGPNGVAVMVDCLTDNRNRTVSDVRHAFTKCGGNLGTDGSVAYLFTKRGILDYPAGSDEEKLMEAALEAGAEDIVTNEDTSISIWTTPEDFSTVRQAMIDAGFEPESAEITMQPSTEVELDLEDAEKAIRLVDMLEDLDDVQNVYTNADFSDEVLAKLSWGDNIKQITRILGIDPGSRITGYGVIEMHGDRSICICNGCIKTPDGDLAGRLRTIHDGLQRIIRDFEPFEMAIESVFVHRNVDSALKLGQARGTAITVVAINNLPVYEYTPSAIKKSVVGRGNAGKAQVQHMVKAILGLSKSPQNDAADALAVALCHGHTRQTLKQSEQLRGMRRRRWR